MQPVVQSQMPHFLLLDIVKFGEASELSDKILQVSAYLLLGSARISFDRGMV